MSGGKLTDHQKVLDGSTNFKNNRTPFTTNSAAISLKSLKSLSVKQKRIALILQGFAFI